MSKGGKKAKRSARHNRSGKYVRQRTRTEVNKARRRRKHADKHPNDKAVRIAMGLEDK